MKLTVAVALCCAAQVFGLGMPNGLLPSTTFSTVPPWQYSAATPNPIGLATPTTYKAGGGQSSFVIPPTFTQTAKQYRRVYDWQQSAAYTPLNNYVLLTNADLSSVNPRSKVLALGPNVTLLAPTALGSTVAHPALNTDAWGTNNIPNTQAGAAWTVNPNNAYVWTGGSIDWNAFVLSSYDQVFDSLWLASLNHADQDVTGAVIPNIGTTTGFVPDTTFDVFSPTTLPIGALFPTQDPNLWQQRWIRSSPQSDGLYFLTDTAILGTISVQNGAQSLSSFKDRKTHLAYGGTRPNHLYDSGCNQQYRISPTDSPAFYGNC